MKTNQSNAVGTFELEIPETITNMYIKANELRFLGSQVKKSKPAVEAVEAVEEVKEIKAAPAIEAVKAVKAVKAVLDKDGNIITPAVEAVKAVKAVPAVEAVPGVKAVKAVEAIPASPGSHKFNIQAVSLDILKEAIARFADQGYPLTDKTVTKIPYGYSVKIEFPGDTPETMKTFRKAFKNIKDRTLYNKPGYDLAMEEEKAKAEVAKKVAAAAKAVKDEERAANRLAKKLVEAKAAQEAEIITKSDPTMKGAKVIAVAGGDFAELAEQTESADPDELGVVDPNGDSEWPAE